MKLESIALHHGYTAEATTKAAAVPIYQITSYTFDDTQHGADLFNLAVSGNIYNPHHEPDHGRAGTARGRDGRLNCRLLRGLGYGCHHLRHPGNCRGGRQYRLRRQLYGSTYNLFVHSFPPLRPSALTTDRVT